VNDPKLPRRVNPPEGLPTPIICIYMHCECRIWPIAVSYGIPKWCQLCGGRLYTIENPDDLSLEELEEVYQVPNHLRRENFGK
jgi:hypothetical protein